MLTTIIKSVDTVVIIGATTTTVTLSVTGVGLILVPISVGITYALSLGNKLIQRIILKKYSKYKDNVKKPTN